MKKIDLKKELKHLYRPSAKEVARVYVPVMNYLMVDGKGDPNTAKDFANAIAALYPLAYTIKFKVKKGKLGIDYGVMPLEALWWADDMAVFAAGDKSRWQWTVMIMQPEFVTRELFLEAVAEVKKKKNPTALALVRMERLEEGPCAQIMHIGPFSTEGPTIKRVHDFIGLTGERTGKHHEIYLSDIRKGDPARWKTVIRQPLRLR